MPTSPPTTAPPDPGAVDRAAAKRVLAGDKYHPAHWPKPFRGVVNWVGDRMEPIVAPIGRFFDRVLQTRGGVLLVLVAVVGVATGLAVWLIRRRSRAAVIAAASGPEHHARLDPAELERQAQRAEAAGELERALRLRFTAGLLRLDRMGVVPFRSDTTTGEVSRLLRSDDFDTMATSFDEVVYGRRPPHSGDVDVAKSAWTSVLTKVGHR